MRDLTIQFLTRIHIGLLKVFVGLERQTSAPDERFKAWIVFVTGGVQ
jgi:hypothetical protein